MYTLYFTLFESHFRPTLFAFVIMISFYGLSLLFTVGRRGKNMPPGPRTIPLFGNELQIPATNSHILLTEWVRDIGGLISLKRFSNTTLVISSRRLVKELLDKRSNIYSHRPRSTVADLITKGDHLLIMDYGPKWRSIRKLIHQYFMEPMCESQHIHVQHAEAAQMVHDFLVDPTNHMLHPKRYSNSITMSLVYGIRTKTISDDYMVKLFALMEKWSLVMELGATPPVDSFPILKWVPQKLLGNWIDRATEVGDLMIHLYRQALCEVEGRRARGVRIGSFMDRVLDTNDKHQLTRNQLYFLGGVLMEGGSETSGSLILAIILAMIAYPRVQQRAQAEIDAVVKEDRSPLWSDFDKLPYINMIIKEAHRWRPASPLGVPHALGEDDRVHDMHLPKGSTVILNVWAMHHDPATWKDPQHFIPERYEQYPALSSTYAASGKWEERDHYGYGAGRRICPGMHLADRNLFVAVAKLLWAFGFSVKQGAKIDISVETGLSKGLVNCVRDYGLDIELRTEAKRGTIMKELADAQKIFNRFE